MIYYNIVHCLISDNSLLYFVLLFNFITYKIGKYLKLVKTYFMCKKIILHFIILKKVVDKIETSIHHILQIGTYSFSSHFCTLNRYIPTFYICHWIFSNKTNIDTNIPTILLFIPFPQNSFEIDSYSTF